jgi:hypothetical protein
MKQALDCEMMNDKIRHSAAATAQIDWLKCVCVLPSPSHRYPHAV